MRSLSFVLIVPAIWCFAVSAGNGQHYRAPAGERPAAKRMGAESILPGGRLLTPHGQQHITGLRPFGLAVSPNGKRIATADIGAERYSVTVFSQSGRSLRRETFEAPRDESPEGERDDWRGVSVGIKFEGNGRLYVSEGNSGRVRVMNAGNGKLIRTYNLNQGDFRNSYSADLALDQARRRLYVVDQANFRLAVVDTRNGRVTRSVPVGRLPLHVSLSPDRRQAFVTNLGMFRYEAIPGAVPQRSNSTGLSFPAFGFPSNASRDGAARQTESGEVQVPGLGDPNVAESNSVTVVDLNNPDNANAVKTIRTGLPFGGEIKSGSGPSGVIATAEHVFVSNGHNDSITIIDRKTLEISGEIPLRISGLEDLRGVMPIGLAHDLSSNRLYVAEAGINAIGVIDIAQRKLLGHIPAGWFPTALAVRDGTLFVANAEGQGTGPNATREAAKPGSSIAGVRHGTLSVMAVPESAGLAALSGQVMANNGFAPVDGSPTALPEQLKYVVLIIKENRSFDEIFGDLREADNGPVAAAPGLARFGNLGYAQPERTGLVTRGVLRDMPITPNHHALAERFAFSDNFYCESKDSVEGHRWTVGSYPGVLTKTSPMNDPWGQVEVRQTDNAPGRPLHPGNSLSLLPEDQPEKGTLWHHLAEHRIPFRNFGEGFVLAPRERDAELKPTGVRLFTNVPMPEPLYRATSLAYPGFNTNIPDQYRASQFIDEIEELYRKPGKDLPKLLYVHLPNDHMASPRPEDGFPFRASYVADNDIALGRIVEYLSHSPWWKNMAILVTEGDAQGGLDHVDSHRSIVLAISPYARKNFVSHRNVSLPGFLKTAFRILGLPPLNLYDATASDLADCFTNEPDFSPYEAITVSKELFDPETAR